MKLSKYPTGTVIQIVGIGRCSKGINTWLPFDRSARPLTFKEVNKIKKNEPHKIRINSLPWSVVAELLFMLQDEYGSTDAEGKPITPDSILKDAIERDEESKNRPFHGAINYATADISATRELFRKIHRPATPTTKSMFEEEWRKIPGHNWSCSNLGRVRNDNISQHITRPYVKGDKTYVELTDDQGRYVETSMSWIIRHTFPEQVSK